MDNNEKDILDDIEMVVDDNPDDEVKQDDNPDDEVKQDNSLDDELKQDDSPIDEVKVEKSEKKEKKKLSKKKKIARGILITLAAVVVALGLFVFAHYWILKSSASDLKTELLATVECVKTGDVEGANKAMDSVRKDVENISKVLDSKLVELAKNIPDVENDVNSAKILLEVFNDADKEIITPLIEMSKETPLSSIKSGDGIKIAAVNKYVDFAAEVAPKVVDYADKLGGVQFKVINFGSINEYIEKIKQYVPLLDNVDEYKTLLNVICGDGEDKTYFIMAQNSAEIRASGGFPGACGIMKIKDGVLDLSDFGAVKDYIPYYSVGIPDRTELEGMIFGEMYLYQDRDACYNPHFPKVASITKQSYEKSKDPLVIERLNAMRNEALITEQSGEVPIEASNIEQSNVVPNETPITKQPNEASDIEQPNEVLDETPITNQSDEAPITDQSNGMPEKIDGVISLTPKVIQDMLAATGETLTLDDGTLVDGSNATCVLQHDLYYKYYSFNGAYYVNDEIVDKLFAQTASLTIKAIKDNLDFSTIVGLFDTVESGFKDRTIMIWLENEADEDVIKKLGASGSLNYDEQNPEAGIFFSNSVASKMGMYVHIDYEVAEPVLNENGELEYGVKVKFSNTATEEDLNVAGYVKSIMGEVSGNITLFAPMNGRISDIVFDKEIYANISRIYDLDVAYLNEVLLYPGDSVTATYKITVPKGVTTPLKVVHTPTLQEYILRDDV